MLMLDECVGHMTEKVVIPEPDEIEIVPRELTDKKPGEYQPYATNGWLVPENVRAGDGYRFHTTGLTHDERGYPVMTAESQDINVNRIINKIKLNADDIIRIEEEQIDGAEVVVVAYGITARVARMGVDLARKQGVKVGFLRLVVVWPFPEKRIAELAAQIKAFVVPEINLGQMVLEVERCAAGKASAVLVGHAGGGVHDPQTICDAIVEAAR
jgi:2-oxoglutarate ferredoxin oxidoreductase subunit alpha